MDVAGTLEPECLPCQFPGDRGSESASTDLLVGDEHARSVGDRSRLMLTGFGIDIELVDVTR
jgi:hypothetical protein